MTDKRFHDDDSTVLLQYEMTSIVREEIGFTEHFASQIAEAIVRGMRRRLGPGEIYIAAPSKLERDAAIKAEYNGRNLDEVCRKYGLRASRIYEIVKLR